MRIKIKNDCLIARKNGEKEKSLVLNTLIAEIERNEPKIINGEKTWSNIQIYFSNI
jgi:hypothetical protein